MAITVQSEDCVEHMAYNYRFQGISLQGLTSFLPGAASTSSNICCTSVGFILSFVNLSPGHAAENSCHIPTWRTLTLNQSSGPALITVSQLSSIQQLVSLLAWLTNRGCEWEVQHKDVVFQHSWCVQLQCVKCYCPAQCVCHILHVVYIQIMCEYFKHDCNVGEMSLYYFQCR